MNIESIVVSALISIVIAWLTMRLALHRFYREKWWDKKATAYLDLIDVLYDFKEGYRTINRSELAKVACDNNGQPIFIEDVLSKEDEAELWAAMLITHRRLSKIKGLGPLVFTDAALGKISSFINKEEDVRRMVYSGDMHDFEAYGEIKRSAESLYNEFKDILNVELKLKIGVKSKLENLIQWIFTQYIRAEHEYRKNLQ